jgi:hypothetical protein
MLRSALALGLVVLACSRNTETAPAPASEPTIAPSAEPAPAACVKECLARNQMRAEAAEKLEAECRKECR